MKTSRIIDRTEFQCKHWDKLQPGCTIKALNEIWTITLSSEALGQVEGETKAGRKYGCYIEQVQEIHTENEILVQESRE